MIFWMTSAFSEASLTPSKTLACLTEVKSLMISGGSRGWCNGERGFAGKRDEADILEGFWNDEMQISPATGNDEDGHFIGANGKGLRNAFRNRNERNLWPIAGFALQRVGEALQFGYELHGCPETAPFSLRPGERSQQELRRQDSIALNWQL